MESAAPSGLTLSFLPHEDARFVRLQAGPCPLYQNGQCSIYESRPYQCRRFACMRDDLSEPYDWRDRDLTRDQRRQLVVIQRHAQRWARSHGWEAE